MSESPFVQFCHIRGLVERNPNLFRTQNAAYYFIERHYAELASEGALIRLGSGPRAPLLVHEDRLLAVCQAWAASRAPKSP